MTAPTTKLYLAYGSNMNRAQMARRCPKAKALRAIVVDDARLVFRGVADIEYHAGASVPVVLWEITAECERALDRYEGVAAGVYEKKLIPLDNGEQALTYVMRNDGIAPPSRDYYERIKQGYADFGIDPEPLDVALKHSHVKTAHTPETRRRMARNMAQGSQQARRPMHVPLSKVNGKDDKCEGYANGCCCTLCQFKDVRREASWDAQNELFDARACKHGREPAFCTKCREENEAQRKPVARPVEGYNYSEAAKRGTRSKDGKPTGRKVTTDGHGFDGETEATRTGVVRYNAGKRSNTKVIKSKNKNLGDWMRERGYK